MKKLTALMMALLMLASMAAATAESDDLQGMAIPENTEWKIDVNGDGAEDTVLWQIAARDEYTYDVQVTVTPAGGAPLTYMTDIEWGARVYAADLNGDGSVELLVSGDVMSDDYYTYCLHVEDGALTEVLFADICRGENADEPLPYGYGLITDIRDGRITLSGSQDVLGTWFGSRVLALAENGTFETVDTEWVRDVDPNDPEMWEYAALTLTQPIEAAAEDGSPMPLNPGDKLMVISSDKVSYVRFALPDGTIGRLSITPNAEQGWGSYVNGIAEDDLFEFVPYAD